MLRPFSSHSGNMKCQLRKRFHRSVNWEEFLPHGLIAAALSPGFLAEPPTSCRSWQCHYYCMYNVPDPTVPAQMRAGRDALQQELDGRSKVSLLGVCMADVNNLHTLLWICATVTACSRTAWPRPAPTDQSVACSVANLKHHGLARRTQTRTSCGRPWRRWRSSSRCATSRCVHDCHDRGIQTSIKPACHGCVASARLPGAG